MDTLDNISRWLSRALLVIGGVLLVLLMLHVVADITMKYLLRRPIIGTLEIVASYYMVGIAYLPIAYVQYNKRHLMVEMFTMGLSDRGRSVLDGVVEVATFVYVSLLTWLLFLQAVDATRRNEIQDITFFDLPIWPSRWILFAGFASMSAIIISQALMDLRYGLLGQGRPPQEHNVNVVSE